MVNRRSADGPRAVRLKLSVMGINIFGLIGLIGGLVLVSPLAPNDPPVAPTVGFFLDDWKAKSFDAPGSREGAVAAQEGAVTVNVDASDVITKIPPSVRGQNADSWMTGMISEPIFIGHVRDLRPHVIRWPAGSGSDGYWWDRAPGDLPAEGCRAVGLDRAPVIVLPP